MTRDSSPGKGTRAPSRRTTGDPYGLAAARPFLAPLLSLTGLAVIGLLTVALLTGSLPFLPSKGSGPANPDRPGGVVPVVPGQTPSPSEPPVVNPDVGIDGTLVYAKAGNLWIQQGTTTRQLTKTTRDSQPAWSEDGAWIYFIETRSTRTTFARLGVPQVYDLSYPILTRIRPDGTDRQAILSGLYRTGSGKKYGWSYFIRDPAVSPDGRNVAVVSDGPDPTKSDVVLGLVGVAKKRLSPLGCRRTPRSATRIPRGGPTASPSCTSAMPGTAPAGRPRSGATTSRRRRPPGSASPATRSRATRPTGAISWPPRPARSARTSWCSTRATRTSCCG
jgi:hypothetical protein